MRLPSAVVCTSSSDLDAAEIEIDELPDRFVVIARHEDDPRSLLRLLQHVLHHVVVRLIPIPAPPQLPAVDDVADQVKRFRFRRLQEFKQLPRLAPGGAEMNVGYPYRLETLDVFLVMPCLLAEIRVQEFFAGFHFAPYSAESTQV